MDKNTTGPKGTGITERLHFAPVRVSAALRRMEDSAAQELADRIDVLLGSVSERAAANPPTAADWGPRIVRGRLIRMTPGLLQYVKEQTLLLDLNMMIWESLEANPEWSDLRVLLW